MGEITAISWTDKTFNPWMGCHKVSDGCKNCYAEEFTKNRMGLRLWGPSGTTSRQVTSSANWEKPLRWNRLAKAAGRQDKVFCASLCDWLEDHPTANRERPRLLELIRSTPNLIWQLLTKRPERLAECLPSDWGGGWPNVWLGTTIEDMRVAGRADLLRIIPAAIHFISYEPALGPLDDLDIANIQWIIYGGESGPRFRPENKDWARTMRDRCEREGVAFFHKQSANRFTERGVELDGEIVHNMPWFAKPEFELELL